MPEPPVRRLQPPDPDGEKPSQPDQQRADHRADQWVGGHGAARQDVVVPPGTHGQAREQAERTQEVAHQASSFSLTPASAKVAIWPRIRAAASTMWKANTAPVPSPRRRLRSMTGVSPR